MVHERRVSGWLRRHRPRSPLPEHHDAAPNTANNAMQFAPPPAVEALPPYSPPAQEAPQAVSVVDTTTPPQPADPPPSYQPLNTPPPPSPTRPISRSQEAAHLQTLLTTRFPWRRRTWGPPPTTFASALNKAALLGHHALVLALLDEYGVPVQSNTHHAIQTTTPVHEALRGPEPWLAHALITRYAGRAADLLASRDSVGCTPLHVAAEAGETAIARAFVLFYGAEVDAVDAVGRTPLHMAARYGRVETMEMLLGCGTDPGRVNGELWVRAEGDGRKEGLLGSWGVVERNVREAVERWREAWGRDLEGVEGEGEVEEGKDGGEKAGPSSGGVAYASLVSAGPSRLEAEPRGSVVSQPRVHPGSLHGKPRVDRNAERLAVTYGYNEVEAAQRVLQHLARASTMQRPVPSMLFSHEYQVWKNDCQTLLKESKKQKEKNRRETGNELDPY
ncbi:ankyrin repeat-containing domain protein [Cercophora newfieldiana]|uniref:Ankyrin repeat-containing domain protein n=1 Tax=Cercophora newfieldiana TaxID=92897 RepID=A0AA39YCL9_9PEZI|nr:ankyrin repeat-containing domain protein [Cercophora newfieldiana]